MIKIKPLKRYSREFFENNTEVVAKELIGSYLVRDTPKGRMIGKIIETEAYLGAQDKACHTYNYKKTERTKVMYEKAGTWYVYLIYGMYHCLNVITESAGNPCAVLIRQLYPIDGIEQMKTNRPVKLAKNYKNLLDGPGKLCIAFDITKKNTNGKDSCAPKAHLFLTKGEKGEVENITSHKRIGIDYAEEDRDRLLRFKLNDQ
ncbi:MAG: putative 3-methyladenine DNA glycosylase [Promethearchaeota archaeon]|nr:MAG: putative 3-methyladenine DNA glycosylase [Candidatus Lokiarchaeota archaeon]